jgi:putative spermidine/putrescine transport system permease protein
MLGDKRREGVGWRNPAVWAAWLVLAFLSAPSLIVLPLSFSDDTVLRFPPQAWSSRWYVAFFASMEWREAATRSLLVATATTLVAMPVGVATALALRNRSGRWENIVRITVLSPIFVPGVLFGVAVLFLYARLRLNNTLLGLVLAHSAVALPFVTVLMEAGIAQLDRSLEVAAASLGASPLRVLATVTLPLLRPSILSAALFAFLASFDEIALAYFISSGDYATLPRRMFSALRDSIDPTIAVVSSLLIVITSALIMLTFVVGMGQRRTRQTGLER